MRGPFDALQRWPFCQRVTLSLLDQVNNRNHVTESFRPDPTSNSFQRPAGEMNVASGCPQFASLNLLDSTVSNSQNCYVRDNVMFVKVSVEGEGP